MENHGKSAAFVIVVGIAAYFHFKSGVNKSASTPADDLQADSTLVKLAFVFRHGERSPLKTRHNDPYPLEDTKFWPDGRGSLTKNGKKNAFMLGRRLRKRYDAILSPYYSKQNFTAVSTKVERTLMSAYLVLAGLFPPASHQKWSDEINWTPIPVYHNTVFKPNNCFACPRFLYDTLKLAHSTDPQKFSPVLKFLEEKTDYKLKESHRPQKELLVLSDSLLLQKRQGYKTVDWADEYIDLTSDIVHEMFQSVTVATEVQRKLSSSLMADYLLEFMEDQTKVSMFSGHDLTLYILASVLGYDLRKAPHPTACLIVEFHEDNAEQFVKAFYIKESAGEMVPVEMSCGEKCSLAAFTEMLLATKPDDYDALCNEVPEDAASYADPFLELLVTGFSKNV